MVDEKGSRKNMKQANINSKC